MVIGVFFVLFAAKLVLATFGVVFSLYVFNVLSLLVDCLELYSFSPVTPNLYAFLDSAFNWTWQCGVQTITFVFIFILHNCSNFASWLGLCWHWLVKCNIITGGAEYTVECLEPMWHCMARRLLKPRWHRLMVGPTVVFEPPFQTLVDINVIPIYDVSEFGQWLAVLWTWDNHIVSIGMSVKHPCTQRLFELCLFSSLGQFSCSVLHKVRWISSFT